MFVRAEGIHPSIWQLLMMVGPHHAGISTPPPSGHVPTSSTWTLDPTPTPQSWPLAVDMFKLVQHEVRLVGKWAVGILLECFLVEQSASPLRPLSVLSTKKNANHLQLLGFTFRARCVRLSWLLVTRCYHAVLLVIPGGLILFPYI